MQMLTEITIHYSVFGCTCMDVSTMAVHKLHTPNKAISQFALNFQLIWINSTHWRMRSFASLSPKRGVSDKNFSIFFAALAPCYCERYKRGAWERGSSRKYVRLKFVSWIEALNSCKEIISGDEATTLERETTSERKPTSGNETTLMNRFRE